MADATGISDFGTTVPYDLRQIYAVEIVGNHLKDMMAARKGDHYPNHFKCMKDLFIVIKHKVKKKTYPDAKGDDVNAVLYYNAMIEYISKLARENPNQWLMINKHTAEDLQISSQIEDALAELEMFLYEMIQSSGLLGGKDRIPGL